MSNKRIALIIGLILLVAGLGIIGLYDGWLEALGVFLCFMSHNLEKHCE